MKRSLGVLGLLPLFAACGDDDVSGTTGGALTGVCVDDGTEIPAGAVMCGFDEIVECDAEALAPFYVTAAELGLASCGVAEVGVSVTGVLPVGPHIVVASTGSTEVCTATVTVVDTTPPEVSGRSFEIWPAHHKWVDVLPRDCADWSDVCGPTEFRFTSVSVDEAENDRGDGHTSPDVDLGCDTLRVRAERQGGGDGRIYRVGFTVTDAVGNVTPGSCDVVVPHDQSARAAVWSGEVDRFEVPPEDCGGAEPAPDAGQPSADAGAGTDGGAGDARGSADGGADAGGPDHGASNGF